MRKWMKTVLVGGLALTIFVLGSQFFSINAEDGLRMITKEDFENCEPKKAMVKDEFKDGYWNLRIKTWGSPLLCVSSNLIKPCPDLTYDPKLKGTYNIYVESRAMPGVVKFGLKLSFDADFTEITVPNEEATPEYHYNVRVLWKKNVKMDGQKIVIRDLGRRMGEPIYIDAFKFEPMK